MAILCADSSLLPKDVLQKLSCVQNFNYSNLKLCISFHSQITLRYNKLFGLVNRKIWEVLPDIKQQRNSYYLMMPTLLVRMKQWQILFHFICSLNFRCFIVIVSPYIADPFVLRYFCLLCPWRKKFNQFKVKVVFTSLILFTSNLYSTKFVVLNK